MNRLLRPLLLGTSYGLGFITVEVFAVAVLMGWVSGDASILGVLRADLARMALEYAALGAAAAVLVSPLTARLRRVLPPRLTQEVGLDLTVVALVFCAVALLWNPESIVPRRHYLGLAFAANVPVALTFFVGRAVARLLGEGARRLAGGALLSAFVAALVGLGFLTRPPTPPAPLPGATFPERPNVLVVVVDTLRADHVSAYGYARPTTPVIDRLAAEGALFRDARTTETWTLPGHASLFTGLYTTEHQAHLAHTRLGDEAVTFAEVLRGAGYRTAAFSANPWLSSISGLGQGFDRFEYLGIETTTQAFFLTVARRRLAVADLGGREVTDAARAFLRQATAAPEPFLLFVNYMEAHEPYGSVPEPWFSRWLPPGTTLPRDIGQQWVRETGLFQCASCEGEREGLECREGRWRITEERLAPTVALYDAGVSYVDALLGELVTELEAAGQLDDTLIIVTSDHGEALGERGQIGHGAFLYDAVLHVPLVLRHPRSVPPGTVVHDPVSVIDVFPTIEAVAGLAPRAHRHARSLVAEGTVRAPQRPAELAEYVPYANEQVWRAAGRVFDCDYGLVGRPSVAVMHDGWKLIRSGGAHPVEVYDLAADPREEQDLVGRDATREQALGALLEGRLRTLDPVVSPAGESPELDEPTKAALRALGYLQ